MNCQEVMELIQRYVDRDLNEQEASLMHDHVGQCPECKSMLNRLVLLSQGLEQLPRVEPPYSLVDALLPKLEQYEAEELAGETAEETAAAPPNRRRAVSRRVRIARISSALAVCVIAVIIAINGSLLDQTGKRTREEMASTPESAKGENLFAADASAGSAQMYVTDQFGDPPTEAVPQPTAPDTAVSKRSSSSDATSNQGNTNDTGTDQDTPLFAMEGSAEAHEGPGMMGLANAAEDAVSPDGAWRAVLAEGVLVLYAAQDGLAVFRHDPAPGTISGLVWREDGKALEFTFTDAEGRSSAQSLLVPELKITMR